MSRLVYSAIASLDGYVNDASGSFDWAAPEPEVHAFVNDLERSIGTYLYGRRMYETMRYWQDPPAAAREAPEIADYAAVWQAADKIVYSTTLDAVDTPRTRLRREFDPAEVAALKASAPRDISVGGPGLAAAALRAGLVDECHLLVVPAVVGGGTGWLPDELRVDLELREARRVGPAAYLSYGVLPQR